MFQVTQCSVESGGYCILSGSIWPVCKLMWVEGGGETGFDVFQYQFFKALCDDWGECYWAEVVEIVCG